MRVVNNSIRREDRALVQSHLDVLNKFLPAPDLTQMDVVVGADGIYTLETADAARVTKQLEWAVSHQLPSPTSPALPSIAPSVKAAVAFFGLELPDAPTGSLDVGDAGIDRP